MVTGAERLDERGLDRMLLGIRLGDPDDEVLGAWLAKEAVRDVYLAADVEDAELLLDKAIVGCSEDSVGEIRSLGRTLARWRTEILNRHRTGASNGPTEGLNLLVKKLKRAGHGFRSFANYRLRILLHAGAVRRPPNEAAGALHQDPLSPLRCVEPLFPGRFIVLTGRSEGRRRPVSNLARTRRLVAS